MLSRLARPLSASLISSLARAQLAAACKTPAFTQLAKSLHTSVVRSQQIPTHSESPAQERFYAFQRRFPKWMHKTVIGAAAGFPAAFIVSFIAPHWAVVPFDILLGLVVPLHAYIGTTMIIQDYVPQPIRFMTVILWTIFIIFGTIGLLKLNLCGPGITESIKAAFHKGMSGARTRALCACGTCPSCQVTVGKPAAAAPAPKPAPKLAEPAVKTVVVNAPAPAHAAVAAPVVAAPVAAAAAAAAPAVAAVHAVPVTAAPTAAHAPAPAAAHAPHQPAAAAHAEHKH